MARDTEHDMPISETQSPWRFLTPLGADSPMDRELIALTRKDELRVVTDMVAASEISILYAFSGNGKTSLINAGVIPFFRDREYVVFRTRPRPPWSIHNPTRAFKDCILRDLDVPLFGQSDLDLLDDIRLQLASLPEGQEEEIDRLLTRLGAKIKQFPAASQHSRGVKSYLQDYIEEPLPTFISIIRLLLGNETRIIIICDQFEELFVHYGNTPELSEFVGQLGEVWADDSLKTHLLFSMREDWVGSMIEFRRAIPDIFANYFKLDPITRSRARDALTYPLRSIGGEFKFEDRAVGQILDDLVRSYSLIQEQRSPEDSLTPSPHDDPFIELPALQVVAEKLWETRGQHRKPFSLAHYDSLENVITKEFLRELKPSGDTASQKGSASPVQIILDSYLADQLSRITDSAEHSPKVWRDLRLDCLYLLTDKIRHRRALTAEVLMEQLNQIRPTELDLPRVDSELLAAAVDPLVKARLVRKEATAGGGKQYELAHDYAVRSVVRNWRRLDRERTSELAVILEERKAKEEALSELREEREAKERELAELRKENEIKEKELRERIAEVANFSKEKEKREEELSRLREEREAKDKELSDLREKNQAKEALMSELAANRRRSLRFLQFTPAPGIIALLALVASPSLGLHNSYTLLFLLPVLLLFSSVLLLVVGLLNRQRLSTIIGEISLLVSCVYVYMALREMGLWHKIVLQTPVPILSLFFLSLLYALLITRINQYLRDRSSSQGLLPDSRISSKTRTENSIVKILKPDGKVVNGTGFFVDSMSCVTCYHVIKDMIGQYGITADIFIEYRDERTKVRFDEEKSNPEKDIAVLKTEISDAVRLPLARETKKSMDGEVRIYGYRKGFEREFRLTGILRPGTVVSTGELYILETSMPSTASLQGMSGGPVCGIKSGRVVGILKGEETAGPSVSYVVPIDTVYEHWPELRPSRWRNLIRWIDGN